MEGHVRILGTLFVVLSIIGIVAGVLLFFVFGGIATFLATTQNIDADARAVIPVLGIIGGFLFLLFVALSVPGIIVGFGLLKFRPWARIVAVVLCAVHLLSFPVGTAFGAYGLWVLLNQDSARLFGQ